jgi:hypothetical protein
MITKRIYQLNYKIILGGVVDLVVLPSFAKFIFNIDYDIKKIIIDIIEICLKRNLVYINRYKLYNFLNNFYLYDGNLKFNAEIVMNLLQIKDSELQKGDNYDNENNNYYGGVPNNITQQIFDFNKKIKEYLNDSNKKLEQINSLKIETKESIQELKNDNITNDMYYSEEEKDKKNAMLNKKRKKEEEDVINIDNEDIDKSERKGNKKKSKNTKRGKNKTEDNNINDESDNMKKKDDDNLKINENNFENDKEINNDKKDENKNEEEIQIDDDIDIPDIV